MMTDPPVAFTLLKAAWDIIVGLVVCLAAIALIIWLIVSIVHFFWSNPLF